MSRVRRFVRIAVVPLLISTAALIGANLAEAQDTGNTGDTTVARVAVLADTSWS